MYLSIRWRMIFSIVGPLVVISVLVMWLTIGKIFDYSVQQLNEQSIQRAKSYATELDGQFQILAQVAHDTAAVMEVADKFDEETLYALLRSNVARNPLIYGSAIAFAPHQYNPDQGLFSPYVYRNGDTLEQIDIGSQAYDYTDGQWEWYSKAKLQGEPVWTEPYFDEGAGNILMETYAVPFYRDGQLQGVATIDIPLEKLQEYMANKYLQDKPFIIVSAEGKFISHPLPEMIMHKTIQQRAKESSDPNLVKLSENLLNKKSGVIRVERLDILSDQPFWIYYAPIKSTGWSFATATPEIEILEFLNEQIARVIFGVFILLLLVIVSILLVSTRITRPLTSLAKFAAEVGEGNFSAKINNINTKDEIGKLVNTFNHMVQQLRDHVNARTREAAAREATESELRIAREIQVSLLPDEFPPFPEHDEFDLYAVNSPAKQVGGDFFDYFFIDDDKLLFVIGDVSGKGTPAAIVMAVARTLIRDLARNISSPAEILTETNCLLVEIQKHPVFITIFLAIYEVKTGRVKYVNAGHQPPCVLNSKGEIKKFGETTGTIVGMLDDAVYKEREATLQKNDYLIAYTDGIPDARSPDGHFYGEEHFVNLLKSCANLTVKEICENVINEVIAFQAKNLADDVTLLILKHCE